MINYSIIIPFKGQFNLLNKACASIPDRGDIQILIIDNNEIEPSNDIIKNNLLSAYKNSTISYLFSSPNKGAGHARNIGLINAVGKWVLFLDSDDYFSNTAFDLFDKYLNSSSDIIFFNIQAYKVSTGQTSKRADYISKFINNRNEDLLRYRCPTPYCKMIKSELIRKNSIMFDEVKVSNDMFFSCLIGYTANTVSIDNNVAYVVTEAEANNSLTKQRTRDNQYIRYKIAVKINIYLEKINKQDLKYPLISFILRATAKFGIKEGYKYYKYARLKKQNIFRGKRI